MPQMMVARGANHVIRGVEPRPHPTSERGRGQEIELIH